jgi:BCD family chlorophyll transporter-like MFS transporter
MSGKLGWLGIVRLGLVQTALGSIVVLTTSTINRVMVVELALPAMLPGLLVGLHYALQILRPRWGYGSDTGGRRTPWILFGMVVLATGGAGAAVATALMSTSAIAGTLAAFLAFSLVGIGVGAAGTSLLALLASRVEPERRAAAATIVWLMMIAGFIVTTITAGKFLDPYSPARLVAVACTVSVIALVVSFAALFNVEGHASTDAAETPRTASVDMTFRDALSQIWDEGQTRRFTIFVFISMLAYSMQDLILEPFAGLVFDMTPGQSTQLSGVQHSGVFCGMIMVALLCRPSVGMGSLRTWTIGGCIASAIALLAVVVAGAAAPSWPIKPTVFLLGLANGAFAVAAIGSMMELAGSGQKSREGVRMGLWGASQAIAFGIGGFSGAILVDAARQVFILPAHPYMAVFALEGLLFLISAAIAIRAVGRPASACGVSGPHSKAAIAG